MYHLLFRGSHKVTPSDDALGCVQGTMGGHMDWTSATDVIDRRLTLCLLPAFARSVPFSEPWGATIEFFLPGADKPSSAWLPTEVRCSLFCVGPASDFELVSDCDSMIVFSILLSHFKPFQADEQEWGAATYGFNRLLRFGLHRSASR